MTPSPFELPVKASEAAQLADVTFQLLENRTLNENLRSRLAARAAGLTLTSIRPYWGSLQQDPVHASSYYVAVDGLAGSGGQPSAIPLLLRIALASAPSSGLFPKSTLIGRMRPGGGDREVVVSAASFGPDDAEAIGTFTGKVDRAFLPRPQASAPAITVLSTDPARELPVAFEGFRAVQRASGLNIASIAAAPGQSRQTMTAAQWCAIRAGWRDGYNVEAEPVSLALSGFSEAVRPLAAFTRFRVDLSEPEAGAMHAPPPDSLDWALGDFSRRMAVGEAIYQFEPEHITALHARFAAPLTAAENLYDTVRRVRSAAGYGRVFDFEVVLPADADPREAFFCQLWLKLRGRPVTLVAPSLVSVEEARLHAAIARHFGAALSFDAGVLPGLPNPGQWAGSRWNCRVTGGEITAARVQAAATAMRA